MILDEVQRFRDVLQEASNPQHIAAELFARRVPVLILSATPYRALTLGHEVADGDSSHHEDFFNTLDFLFDRDRETPNRIRAALKEFGARLQKPDSAETLDLELLRFKHRLEADLTQVICRTERNWYVLDRRKGVDDTTEDSGTLPSEGELEEYFRLHRALAASSAMGQVTEFWKSAPSLLTFLDSRYALLRELNHARTRVPRALLTSGDDISSLARRNHRISRVVDIALGSVDIPPRLWTAPTYPYYRDEFYQGSHPRKVLVFSGWRFVPKAIAIIASQAAAQRFGGDPKDPTQPLRLTDRKSFHVFDVCFPSPALARLGAAAYVELRRDALPDINEVVAAVVERLRNRLEQIGVSVVDRGSDPAWQIVMRLELKDSGAPRIRRALDEWVSSDKEETSDAIVQHKQWTTDWLAEGRSSLELSEARLRQLALVAAFSPANCVFRALESVYGAKEADDAFSGVVALCLGSMRRYFNRPHVQQIVRQHRFRLRWRETSNESEHGYAERALVYAGDAHLQAVLDEYVHLQRHAAQSETVEKAIKQLDAVWKLREERLEPTERPDPVTASVSSSKLANTRRILLSHLARTSQEMRARMPTRTRRSAKAWCERHSIRHSGPSSWPRHPSGRKDWTSICTAGTFCTGTSHPTPSISNSVKAVSIAGTVWPSVNRLLATGR